MPGPYHTPGVYIEELPSGSRPIQGVSTAVAAFLGLTEFMPDDDEANLGLPVLVTNWGQFQQSFGSFVKYEEEVKGKKEDRHLSLPLAVYGFFDNGGGKCYVESMGAFRKRATLDQKSNGAAIAAAASTMLKSRVGGTDVLAIEGRGGDVVTVTVADASGPADDLFKVVVQSGNTPPETFDDVTFNKGREVRNVATVINRESKLIKVREIENNAPLNERRPETITTTLGGPLAAIKAPATSAQLVPPKPAEQAVIKGSLEERKGIEGLEAIEEITMVCMPDLMEWQRSGKITLADAVGIQKALIIHCEKKRDRLAILDSPFGMKVQDVKNWRRGEGKYENKPEGANFDSKFAALYYPWITIQNPSGKGQIMVPPSGHVAGLYARVDGERGVHKAPANEVLRGAVSLELLVNNEEQGLLNPHGINCIRSFPGRGTRIWGARTLSSDADWNYINVRRLFNYIEESIFEGIQWAVFEPNDVDLWERVKRSITAFLTTVWRSGALFGTTTQEAFYVKCDLELNPASVRDLGILMVEVGLAPVKPAEFIVVQFKQWSGGGDVTE